MIDIFLSVILIGLLLFLAISLSIANTNNSKDLKKVLLASMILIAGFISLLIYLIL